MAFTLIINPGSSSKKFALFSGETLVLEAYVERLAVGYEMCTTIGGEQQKCDLLDPKGYQGSLEQFLNTAITKGLLRDKNEIHKVALRIVAPGTYFEQHRVIDSEYENRLKALQAIAPLHIPHIMQEITVSKQLLPQARLLGISDSCFHHTIPDVVRRYSIPENDAREYDIYHYGYHGLSIASVVERASALMPGPLSRVVVCHIGSGVSVTAVRDGVSIDTTMGYSPGSGLLMGTRAGDLPTGALLALMQQKNLKPTDALVYLQTSGGLKGIAGESDIRLLLERRAQGETAATAAIDSFVYHLQKAIGSYIAILGGLDALILTATASQRSPRLRELLIAPLAPLGIVLDTEKNDVVVNQEAVISTDDSRAKICVIKTNEASVILKASQLL